jgi:hypothetical protein
MGCFGIFQWSPFKGMMLLRCSSSSQESAGYVFLAGKSMSWLNFCSERLKGETISLLSKQRSYIFMNVMICFAGYHGDSKWKESIQTTPSIIFP